MAAEGPGREGRPDDAEDIDAQFEEIVAGLRAEQEVSARRRAEAMRQAERQRRDQRQAREAENRPLQGFDAPNPWPPRPRDPAAGDNAQRGSGSGSDAGESSPQADVPGPLRGGPGSDSGAPRSDPDTPGSDPDTPGSDPGAPGSDPGDVPSHPTGPSWRGWEESDEEEHFIQPNPPLPAGDLHLWAIVAGLLGGPLLLILSEVFHVLRGTWWTPAGLLLSVAGVVLLVLRLPKNRDYTDSSGGAQV